MNTITFKNGELTKIANFLGNLKLKNMASLGRTKLIRLIATKNEEYQSNLDEIRNRYFVKDENDKFKSENGKLIYKDKADKSQANNDVEELANDKAVISTTEYSNRFKKLYQALQDYDGEFSNEEALAYEVLMDAFDECFINGKEED